MALTPGAIDPGIYLGVYLEHWLRLAVQRVSRGTVINYASIRNHIPPRLWKTRVADLNRPTIKAWAAHLQEQGKLVRSSVARLVGIMRSVLNEAVDDGLLAHNPAIGLTRQLGIRARQLKEGPPKAFDADQLARFLAVARVEAPGHYTRFAVMAYAGLRSGEARGLRMSDIDLDARTIGVDRQVYIHGGFGPPKCNKPRTVNMSDDLAAILSDYVSARRAYDMRTGRRPQWLLFPEFSEDPSRAEVGAAAARVRVAMERVLIVAGLPRHFTPHSFRHSFATIQLSRGETLLYVARQMGDSLQMTAETYGRWLPVPPSAGGANLISEDRKGLKRRRDD